MQLDLTVVIPTHNRSAFLLDTLTSLAEQQLRIDRFEVVVVDDGSTDDTQAVAAEAWPMPVRCIYQPNQGDAIARNTGADASRAALLVFLDDDMLVEPTYLDGMVSAHSDCSNRIVVGVMRPVPLLGGSIFRRVMSEANPPPGECPVSFLDVTSNNMSVPRSAYRELGGMRKLDFAGSNMWCDVDFAYRARCRGFTFYRSPQSVCYHRDQHQLSLLSASVRMQEASRRSVLLFRDAPQLLPMVPMFHDKTPVNWRLDSPPLIVRKLLRHAASATLPLGVLQGLAAALEQHFPSPSLLRPLYRWVIGGHICRGYRDGLRRYGPVPEPSPAPIGGPEPTGD